LDSAVANTSGVYLALYPAANGGTISMDGVSMTPGNTLLRNGSFERSSVGWQQWEPSTSAAVVTNVGLAHDGSKYLSSTPTISGGSIYQDFGLTSESGQPLALSGWFRAGSATPVVGNLCAWQLGAIWEPSCQPFTATNAGWIRVSTIAQSSTAKGLMRAQVYQGTIGAPLLTDTVTAVRTGDVIARPGPLDPWVFGSSTPWTTTFGGEAIFGSWFGVKQYSRLRFDLPPLLTGASVNSAVLHTFVSNCDYKSSALGNQQLSPYSNPIHVRRLVADFDTTPDAAQGDRTVLAPGAAAYADADITDFVKGWAADPGSNYGVRLDMGEIPGGNYGYCKVASRSDGFGGDPNKTSWLEVTFNEPPAATKRFHPVNPVTVFNSTTGVGTPTTGGLGFTSGRLVTVTGGATGVPTSGVSAVAVSVTATNRTPSVSGSVLVFPNGPRVPNSVETDWPVGSSVAANQAVVPIGQANQIIADVWGGQGDIQIDVTGWFDDGTAATAAGGLRYQPQVGERIADTRYGFGGALVANVTRPFVVSGQGGIPAAGVGAVAVQIHAMGTGPSRIKVWATGDTEPPNSAALVLGSGADQRSALMFVKVGTGGTISVKSSTAATIVLDAMGYFVTSTTAGAGFQPIAPQRIYDSRGALYGGVPVGDVDIRVSDGAGVGAVLVNVIAYQPAGAALVDVYPSGEVHDNFDTILVAGSGQLATSSLAFVRPSGDGRIHVNVWPVSAHIIVDLVGYTGTADTVSTSAGNQITNGSFEVGSASWVTNTACGDAAAAVSFTTVKPSGGSTDVADEGTTYARLVSTSATVAGSMCQNINRGTQPKVGERYTLSMRVRSDPAQPAGRGAIELWELGNNTVVPGILPAVTNVQQSFMTNGAWTESTVSLCAANQNNQTLRAKIYPYGTAPFDVDNVRLTITSDPRCQLFNGAPTVPDLNNVAPGGSVNMTNGGFAANVSDWTRCRAPSAQHYYVGPAVGNVTLDWNAANGVGSRGGYMSTTVSVPGGDRACRPFGGAPRNNTSQHEFTAWVKSADGTQFPAGVEVSAVMHTFSISDPSDYYGSSDRPATTGSWFTATADWQKIVVSWSPPNGTDLQQTRPGSFYVAVIPGIAGKKLLVDEVSETGTFDINPCNGQGAWSKSACFGTSPPPEPPVTPDLEPLKLLTDGQSTFIHDPVRTRCLREDPVTGLVTVVGYSDSQCTNFTPFAQLNSAGLPTYQSWTLWTGFDRCLTGGSSGLFVTDCMGTGNQDFFDILEADSPVTFTLRAKTNGFCLDGLTGSTALLAACSGASTQTWADKPKSGPAPYPVGPMPPPQPVDQQAILDKATGSLEDDKYEYQQTASGVTFVSDVFRWLYDIQEVFAFINPIHKLVQIDIANKLVASGKEPDIECGGLGRIKPDVCSPPKPGVTYRHAEVKPAKDWVISAWSDNKATKQLEARETALAARFNINTFTRATAADGWPLSGSILVPMAGLIVPFKIEYRLERPGLYIYKTNITETVTSNALALALTAELARLMGTRLKGMYDNIRNNFPNPGSPVVRWIVQRKVGIIQVTVGVAVGAVLVGIVVASAGTAAPALAGLVSSGGALAVNGIA
jgi:hypothetical protein